MIFQADIDAFESEKERNFYSKVFAGFIFNELVPGYTQRIIDFFTVLTAAAPQNFIGSKAPPIPTLDLKSLRVSFDNHGYLLEGYSGDNGEFADILIQDTANKVMIPIEAKLYDDWTYEKDIIENSIRHKEIQRLLPEVTIIPILLIKKDKWEDAKKHKHQPGSNYAKLAQSRENAFRVLFWEDLFPVFGDSPRAEQYVKERLKIANKEEMRLAIKDNWFVRSPKKD